MSDVLREFLVAIGYKVDTNSERQVLASEKRVEQALVSGDKRITDAQTAGSAKRLIVANREMGVRTQGAAALIAQGRQHIVLDAQRLKAEQRAAEVRTKLHANAITFAQGLTSTLRTVTATVIGSSAALTAAAVGSTTIIEKMAVGLERLYYASSRTKSSAASLQAFGYAAAQMGSTAEEAIGTVEELAQKMRSSPGFESMFKGLGANTRDAKGNLRETTDILLDLGDAFKKMPVFQQKAYADALGIPERLLMSLTSGDFRKNIEKYQAMLGMAGLKPDEAARKSKAFMDIWRDMSSAINIVAVKVQSALVDKFGGPLEKFTTWLLANSDRIATAIIAIGDTIATWVGKAADLFKAFQNLNPKTQEFLIKIGALAAALILFNSGPIGALLAITAALVAFVDAETLQKLQTLWDRFDALAQKLTGQDGLTVAMIGLGAALALKVLAPLARIVPLLTTMMGLTLPPWLLGMLGLGALAGVANSQGILAGPGDSRSVGEGVLRTLDPGLADRLYGQTDGGRQADRNDDRNLWQRVMPKILGGKDAPSEGGRSGGSRSWRNNNPGNLKYGEFAKAQGAIGQDEKGFAKFPSYDAGRKAQENLLFEDPRYKGKTLAEAMQQYAPPSENDTGSYIGEIAKAAGIGPGTRLDSLSPQQRTAMLDAMQKHEGWQAGSGGPGTADPTGIKGSANHMHGQYGPAGSNLTTVTTAGGRKVTVHKEAAESFKGFLNELEASGYNIQSLGGYNMRSIRGGSKLSQHAYGNAIDVNPDKNPMGYGPLKTDLPPNVSEMAAKWGLSWGGDWKNRKDAMHFEWAGRKPGAVAPTITVPPEAVSRLGEGLNKMEPKASVWEANPFKSAPLGSWSNSSTATTNNITTGPVTNNVSGVGDAKQAAEVIGQKTSRVHADLLRNLQGAVA